MPEEAVISLTLKQRGEQGEVKRVFTRSFIPWGVLKRTMKFAKLNENADIGVETLDEMCAIVVELFGHQFTAEELDAGAEITDVIAVFTAITKHAAAMMPANPQTPPAG